MTSRYRHVVWDWNGTLLDDGGFCVAIMNGMLTRRGLPPISLPFYQAVIEFPVVRYYEKLGFDFSSVSFEEVSDEFVAQYQAGWRQCSLQAGALETIGALGDAGFSQSVLSASLSSHLSEQLDHFSVTGLLHSVSGADNHHGHGKLHIARDHAEATGVEPSSILFVGDTAHDAEVARQAGCDCLLVRFGHYGQDRLKHLGLPVARSMEEVRKHVLGDRLPVICGLANKREDRMDIRIKPLTPELAQPFVDYLGSLDFGHAPHWASCYCRYYHTDCPQQEWMERSGEQNRAEAIGAIQGGQMGGYLAYDGETCVGWCNANDLDRLPRLKEVREQWAAGLKAGCVICFVIHPQHRGRGVARLLLRRAVEDFRSQGYGAVLALPFELPENPQKQYRGTLNMYRENGFVEVEQRDGVHAMMLRL